MFEAIKYRGRRDRVPRVSAALHISAEMLALAILQCRTVDSRIVVCLPCIDTLHVVLLLVTGAFECVWGNSRATSDARRDPHPLGNIFGPAATGDVPTGTLFSSCQPPNPGGGTKRCRQDDESGPDRGQNVFT